MISINILEASNSYHVLNYMRDTSNRNNNNNIKIKSNFRIFYYIVSFCINNKRKKVWISVCQLNKVVVKKKGFMQSSKLMIFRPKIHSAGF